MAERLESSDCSPILTTRCSASAARSHDAPTKVPTLRSVSLTRGEAGQIRDAAAATRRTLGAVRATELVRAADALGVGSVTCLDLGDGRLGEQPMEEVAATARMIIDDFQPDVVVTFGPDGGYGHPDHIASCLATVEAIRTLADPPRLLHAQFPLSKQLLLDLIVEWLTSNADASAGQPSSVTR